jgi:2,5-diketo-D-gluconate reductase A
METTILNNKVKMPLLGFGVFQITDKEQCKQSVITALKNGYRMIDTAACYGNEQAVGEAILESGVKREDIFLVSKVWIQDAGYEATKKSFEKSLENLQTDYLDLYLIHMPYGDYHGSWRAMEELYREGKIKAIGVCNFLPDRLTDLILSHEIVPAVNQIECHPFCQQKELREIMEKYDVKLMAWAPFAEGNKGIFTNETLQKIGASHEKTGAQAVLAWLRQEGIIAIPKSVHEERIIQNLKSLECTLTEEELKEIESMDEGTWLILDIPSVDEVYRLHGIRFEQ